MKQYVLMSNEELGELEHFGVRGMKWGVRNEKIRTGARQIRSGARNIGKGVRQDINRGARNAKRAGKKAVRYGKKAERNFRKAATPAAKRLNSAVNKWNKVSTNKKRALAAGVALAALTAGTVYGYNRFNDAVAGAMNSRAQKMFNAAVSKSQGYRLYKY